MDPKGRVSLPSRFRETLLGQGDPRLVLTTNVDAAGRCLVAYTYPEWLAFQEKIADLPQFDENVIRLKRLHIAGASEATPDRQGRILIPPMLRAYAGLSDDKAENPEGESKARPRQVVFAGLGTTIEIWDRQRWDQERELAKEALPQINEALARLGL
ncbi:MAG: division/cell wall cluster transcriptional repressor MraZ [Deltaproteobacteria bacterium]|nr:division/cell wall cluster transcriptional repressor MraZ [Deltaproteobacteria bacterium]